MPPGAITNPCHNCRRRRLRCDRSWPSCQKCILSRQECLGYGKQFRFVGGQNGQQRRRACRAKAAASESRPPSVSSPLPPPTDPVFQDLSRADRRYVVHFADRVCEDIMVAGGSLDTNPFRELIPLAMKHEFLFQILIATSALHWSNSCRPKFTAPLISSIPPQPEMIEYETGQPWSQPLLDALWAKQKAIARMREAIAEPGFKKVDNEVLLAAVLFFVDFDLIDVGKRNWKGGWKAHLDGATKMLEAFCPDTALSPLPAALRDAIVSELFIYHILGTTLTATGLTPRVDGYILDLWPLLDRAESNSYLLFPQRILWIILSASHLAYHISNTGMTPKDLDFAHRLLEQALSFDIPSWAASLKSTSANGSLDAKQHVAAAHRSAACLYIVHVIPSLALDSSVSVQLLVADTIFHLSSIDKSDPPFKGTTWPTFMVGLHVQDLSTRAWVLRHLMSVWETCPWGYILTAVQLLENSWKQLDEAVEELGSLGALQKLRAVNFECLVV